MGEQSATWLLWGKSEAVDNDSEKAAIVDMQQCHSRIQQPRGSNKGRQKKIFK